MGPPELLGQPPHRPLEIDRGVARPHRVVLVGHGGAEERHDAVAHDLVHRALVAVDGLHHPLEDGVEELPGLLGVPVGEQLHRALHVGEEHGDLLALPLERALRGQDPFGQVFRGVRVRSREAGLSLRGAPDWVGTRRAELCGRGQEGPAALAQARQRGGALLAELRLRWVLLMAPGTLHRGASGPPRLARRGGGVKGCTLFCTLFSRAGAVRAPLSTWGPAGPVGARGSLR